MTRGHLVAHMLYGLETAEQAAELFALASIIDSLFDHRLTFAKTVGGQDNTACITQPGRCNSPIISQWFRFGPVKPQFPDAAGAINGSQRDSLQARRLGTDQVQPAPGTGHYVGIIFQSEARRVGRAGVWRLRYRWWA